MQGIKSNGVLTEPHFLSLPIHESLETGQKTGVLILCSRSLGCPESAREILPLPSTGFCPLMSSVRSWLQTPPRSAQGKRGQKPSRFSGSVRVQVQARHVCMLRGKGKAATAVLVSTAFGKVQLKTHGQHVYLFNLTFPVLGCHDNPSAFLNC